jgi:hypothetical protein
MVILHEEAKRATNNDHIIKEVTKVILTILTISP